MVSQAKPRQLTSFPWAPSPKKRGTEPGLNFQHLLSNGHKRRIPLSFENLYHRKRPSRPSVYTKFRANSPSTHPLPNPNGFPGPQIPGIRNPPDPGFPSFFAGFRQNFLLPPENIQLYIALVNKHVSKGTV